MAKNKHIDQYTHDDKQRLNNPPVGLATPDTDQDAGKKTYQYDPHIDPALQFDSQRAEVEKIINEGLASEDIEVVKAALARLQQLQQPYLNWAGKAEKNSFEVPTVSLHVHERIDTKKVLEAVYRDDAAPQLSLFEQKMPLRKAVDFYKHPKEWANRLVAGDSLLVMNSLVEKEGMAGKVQMIYFDPPYGIKYQSNFQPFVHQRDVKDGKDQDLTTEPEMIKAFRDTWQLGKMAYSNH